MKQDWQDLIDKMNDGSIRAMARLITRVENREDQWLEAMKTIYSKTGKAHVFGITGSPGAGKSTLTDRLTRKLVDKGHSVGIIAIDPSSPFSGGALLGDRLRMKDVSNLDGVFVRSMATRGALGGLSLAARDVIKILDAFGKDIIIIETVGVGQDEVEVVKAADIVMVVCVPGLGDGIQAIKAGIMEIADVFVVNKADRDGADQQVSDIQIMLDLGSDKSKKQIPIVKTIATTDEGISELVDTLYNTIESTGKKPQWKEKQIKEEILSLLEREVSGIIRDKWSSDGTLDNIIKNILDNKQDPYSVVQEMTKTSVKI